MTDGAALEVLRASAWERESAEWEAVAFEVDEGDFVPTFLPDEVSDVVHALERGEPPLVIHAPMRARLSTGVDGWVVEED